MGLVLNRAADAPCRTFTLGSMRSLSFSARLLVGAFVGLGGCVSGAIDGAPGAGGSANDNPGGGQATTAAGNGSGGSGTVSGGGSSRAGSSSTSPTGGATT